jgi:uncharacterized delta-60 repeat protein
MDLQIHSIPARTMLFTPWRSKRMVVGGSFTVLGGQGRNQIGRVNSDGSLDMSFNPGVGGSVHCLGIQADGKILVGGSFTTLGGQVCTNFGRLNIDGSFDSTFNAAGINGSVYTIALQTDGEIVIGGTFSTAGGQTHTRLARLNTNGAVDATFNASADGTIDCVAIQADGAMVVGGNFGNLSGQPRSRIGRLNSAGNVDANFNPGANSFVLSLAVQTDGAIVVGGDFTTLGGATRMYIGRLLADGTVDPSFDPEADWDVYGLALQTNGSVLAAGLFGTLGGQTRASMGRLNATTASSDSLSLSGTLITWMRGGGEPEVSRTWFEATTNGNDWQLLGTGTRIAGGWQLSGAVPPVGADIRARGYVGEGYSDGSAGIVETITGPPLITIQPSNETNVVGTAATFSIIATNLIGMPISYQWYKNDTNLNNGGSISGATSATLVLTNLATSDAGAFSVVVVSSAGSVTSAVANLTIVGVVDSFNPGADALVQCMAVQTDGKILIGGSFGQIGAQARSHIARLNADGTLDTNFNPGASGQVNGASSSVNALAIQPDGKILVGGTFSTLGGQICTNLGRLNPDGTMDTNFNPVAEGPFVNCLGLQPDGKIVVGGWFTKLAGVSCSCIGRLNTNGTFDSLFVGTANNWLYSMAIQSDGKIVAGGVFSTLDGQARNNIGRFNSDGTLDTAFNPGANSDVYCLGLQADGKILVGGYFGTLGGASRANIGRLNSTGTVDSFNPGANVFGFVFSLALQTDGKIVVGGSFTNLAGQTRKSLGRLNADGTLDGNFNPGTDNSVHSVAISPDGSVLVGGNFASLGGQSRAGIGRLNRTDPVTLSLTRAGSIVTWNRGGASPELWRSTLDASTNGIDWFGVGAGSRITGGWQFSMGSAPTNSAFRVRGYISSGLGNASTWIVESSLSGSFPSAPIIHVNDSSFGTVSNNFQFNIQSVSSQTLVIEVSSNLVTWTPVQTNTMTSPGQFLFSDASYSIFPRRFYRVRGQ